MTAWDRGFAEMALARKREEINRALSYRREYKAEKSNICLALIKFKDGTIDVLTAYSNDSAIPESQRLGLELIPDLYANMPPAQRFGCDGMAQYHTEPKLLNYLCANPAIRSLGVGGRDPKDAFYRAVVDRQRAAAHAQAAHLKSVHQVVAVTLVSEIDCCKTCVDYSINRFRHLYPDTPLEVLELGKHVASQTPAQYAAVTVTRT